MAESTRPTRLSRDKLARGEREVDPVTDRRREREREREGEGSIREIN